ncbi:hypothetical protein EES44_24315 [Streptomyces sp. ADI96-15]|nr:hypothetical protein EES44_24315 [Streptomyces sp. ADI96-15]
MHEMIHVQPAAEQRQPFAAWAVAQTPKIRTVGPSTFAVPSVLFAEVPEAVLIGSRVDGHRYVSPLEDELTGVARAESFTPALAAEALPDVPAPSFGPGSPPLTEVPASSDGSDSVSLPESEAAGEDHQQGSDVAGGFDCPDCGRPFKSERGRDTHRRQVHSEG